MTVPVLDAHGRPLRRPIVYLDTYTLSWAFPSSPVPDPALTEVAELAANRGTLCLSIAHATEIGAIPERDHALAVARWLRGLEHNWIAVTVAEQEELEQALRIELGLTTDPMRFPVHPTITGALRDSLTTLRPHETGTILRDPSIAGLVRECHGRIDWERAKVFSLEQFKMLHFNRGHLPPGTTLEQVRDQTGRKEIVDLKVRARHFLRNDSTDGEIDGAVDRLLADPLALPINRISPYLWGAIGERISDQSAESGKFEKRYRSMIWDLRHAVGGAFADVFTCDQYVDGLLGDFRTARGLGRQVSVRGDIDRLAFAAALRRQIEAF